MARRYPVAPKGEDSDPRFTIGLIIEVAEVLGRHGYPAIDKDNAEDFVELQQALFRFLYRGRGAR